MSDPTLRNVLALAEQMAESADDSPLRLVEVSKALFVDQIVLPLRRLSALSTTPAPLDVERLREAMKLVKRRTTFRDPRDPEGHERGFREEFGPPTPEEVAAEYDRLAREYAKP